MNKFDIIVERVLQEKKYSVGEKITAVLYNDKGSSKFLNSPLSKLGGLVMSALPGDKNSMKEGVYGINVNTETGDKLVKSVLADNDFTNNTESAVSKIKERIRAIVDRKIKGLDLSKPKDLKKYDDNYVGYMMDHADARMLAQSLEDARGEVASIVDKIINDGINK